MRQQPSPVPVIKREDQVILDQIAARRGPLPRAWLKARAIARQIKSHQC